ncbi:unnamed protein product, partial [Polarella glacialis]
ALWDELQVPAEVRHSWRALLQLGKQAEALTSHAGQLLGYRDATMLVLHGLSEHDQLMAEVRARPWNSRGGGGGGSAEAGALVARLEQTGGALLRLLEDWEGRFGAP